MSDYKTIEQLCKENPNINDQILSMSGYISQLEKKVTDLEILISHLRNQIDENNKWTATVYAPNKSTYQELELKLKKFESDKQKEIDELWETKIKPLQDQIVEKNNDVCVAKHKNQCKDGRIKQLEEIIKNLNTRIDFAVGYISATQPHTDKHPMEVKKWLFDGFKE